MTIKFANNATTTLAGGINNSALALTVTTGEGAKFPTLALNEYFYATIIEGSTMEIVKVTSRVNDTFGIVRAQQGTTASNFTTAATVELRVTRDGLYELAGERQVLITASGVLKGNGSGTVTAAVAGTDYEAPITKATGYAKWTGSAWTFVNETYLQMAGGTVTGNLTINGSVATPGSANGNGYIRMGATGTGDRWNVVEFYAEGTGMNSGYGSRIWRSPKQVINGQTFEGQFTFEQYGTGGISFNNIGAGPLYFATSNQSRFTIFADGSSQFRNATALGDTAPFVKMKKLTGVMPNTTPVGTAQVAHGLVASKIIGVQVSIYTTSFGYVGPNDLSTGCRYWVNFDGVNLYIKTTLDESADLKNQPFTALITYEA